MEGLKDNYKERVFGTSTFSETLMSADSFFSDIAAVTRRAVCVPGASGFTKSPPCGNYSSGFALTILRRLGRGRTYNTAPK